MLQENNQSSNKHLKKSINMASKNNWNADQMQGTLISDMEKEVKEGLRQTSSINDSQAPSNESEGLLNKKREGLLNKKWEGLLNKKRENPTGDASGKPFNPEPTKGVQTYIALDDYQRLTYFKLKRGKGTTIANLVAEAISQWLDVQEGRAEVAYKE